MTTLYNGDCLVEMGKIPDKSVDMILCDLPYGVLNRQNKSTQWDNIIPFEPLWEQYERVIKDNGAIVLFAQGMFTAQLMMSNPKMWRYNLIWKKGNMVSGFLDAKRKPLRNHEDIVVFYRKQPTYNPQMIYGVPNHKKGGGNHKFTQRCYGKMKDTPTIITNEKYPISVLDFNREKECYHPTQKPVELIRWLVRTYTNEGDLVLDNCMGSGTTGVACVKENRNFIGIELNEEYFKIAQERIHNEESQLTLF